jgi:hypothetical protein
MNNKTVLVTIWVSIFAILFPVFSTLAEELDSTNFKIVDITTQGGGTAQSPNYSTLLSVTDIVADPRLYSTNYKVTSDPASAFRPAVPTVSCFETSTDGYSNCTTGPVELSTGGMVALCGGSGCYDKARFEINDQGNPSDTLYAIQISEDNFSSDIRYIDSSTYEPEGYENHDINDLRTKVQWETDTFNLLGLQEGTQYYLRIIALHGDFTQTEDGPSETATTAGTTSFFDIDIADTSGTSAESDPPFNITFTGDNSLLAGAGTVTSDNLIWMDAETNGSGGFAIVQRGQNGGLYSTTHSSQINSVTGDLDALDEGFGLQSYYVNYDPASAGDITVMTNYNGTSANVGIVDTDWIKVYDANGPIVSGRMALSLFARAAADKLGATDYEENITIVFVPRF